MELFKLDNLKMNGAEEHIQWLREQLVSKETELKSAQRDLRIAEQKVHDLELSVQYFRGVMNAVTGEASSFIKKGEKITPESTDSLSSGLTPKEMMRREFEGMFIKDAALLVINQLSEPAHADDIAEMIFDMRTEEDKLAVRRSLSSELRRGAEREKWKKVGRNLFAPNHIATESKTNNEDENE